MTVYLLSVEIVQLEAFCKEISCCPPKTREDIFSLVYRFLNQERLNSRDFKTFKIDKSIKILEFKVRDSWGNWRAIGTIVQGRHLVLVYAFHKKTQKLRLKEIDVIRARIRRIEL